MSKHSIITILGLFVALMPFLGFPGTWKTFFFVVCKLGIAFLSLTIIARQHKKHSSQAPHLHETHFHERDIHNQ